MQMAVKVVDGDDFDEGLLQRFEGQGMIRKPANATPFFSNPRNGAAIAARSGRKTASWLHRPKKLHNDVISLGCGNLVMASSRRGQGRTPSAEMVNPAKSTSGPISNFFFDKINPFSRQRNNMASILFCKSSKFFPSTKISSTSFLMPGNPAKMASEHRQNSSELLDNPWGRISISLAISRQVHHYQPGNATGWPMRS